MNLVKIFYSFKSDVGKAFSRLPIRTNTFTLYVLILGVLGFFALAYNQPLIAGLLFAVSGFFDIIDGSVARMRKEATVFGAWFADLADKGAETCLLFGISFIPCLIPYLSQNFAILLLFAFAFIFSYIKPHGYFWKMTKDKGKPIMGFDRNSRLGAIYLGLILYPVDGAYLGWAIIISLIISSVKLAQAISQLIPQVSKEFRK